MNMEELKKLLKENRVHFYSYWGKGKLEDLARINKNQRQRQRQRQRQS